MEQQSKCILVVGATGLLGSTICSALATRGDRLVMVAKHHHRLATLTSNLPGHHCMVPLDITEANAGQHIRKVIDQIGGINGIVFSVGGFLRTTINDVKAQDFRSMFEVHAIAPMLLLLELAPTLATCQGCVIGLIDAGVTTPFPNHLAYLVAKGAFETGLKTMALELAPHVRVNGISVGIITDNEEPKNQARQTRLKERSLLCRFGSPDEVAHIVLALLDATWVSGRIWQIG